MVSSVYIPRPLIIWRNCVGFLIYIYIYMLYYVRRFISPYRSRRLLCGSIRFQATLIYAKKLFDSSHANLNERRRNCKKQTLMAIRRYISIYILIFLICSSTFFVLLVNIFASVLFLLSVTGPVTAFMFMSQNCLHFC